jgi:hypothetical protein
MGREQILDLTGTSIPQIESPFFSVCIILICFYFKISELCQIFDRFISFLYIMILSYLLENRHENKLKFSLRLLLDQHPYYYLQIMRPVLKSTTKVSVVERKDRATWWTAGRAREVGRR